jgi:hypothetical protein
MTIVINTIKFFIRYTISIALVFFDFINFWRNRNKIVKYDSGIYQNKKALVFGNGPSIRKFIEENKSNLKDTDIFVCNGFAKSDYFEILKPSNYVLIDPLYFDFNDQSFEDKVVDVIETWENIILKTTWQITLHTAVSNDKAYEFIQQKIRENDNIKWINIWPGRFFSFYKFKLYQRGLGILGGITVTHVSTQIAILRRYNEIYLCGIDLDWLENIRYDMEKHNIYLLNKHFFDEKRIYFGEEGAFKNIDLTRELLALHDTVLGFKELLSFADFLSIKLVRGTKSFAHFIPFKEYK